MTFQVRKSQIPDNFNVLVEDHCQALMDHRHTVDTAAPAAGSLVEACIKRIQYPIKKKLPDVFEADYEVIDDTPPPVVLTLRQKKDSFIHSVLVNEQQEVVDMCPPGKARLFAIQRADIEAKEKKTSEDESFIKEDDARRKRLDSIHRDVATLLAQIEDLTDDTVDQWASPDAQ